jgi:hypothetical protein
LAASGTVSPFSRGGARRFSRRPHTSPARFKISPAVEAAGQAISGC